MLLCWIKSSNYDDNADDTTIFDVFFCVFFWCLVSVDFVRQSMDRKEKRREKKEEEHFE